MSIEAPKHSASPSDADGEAPAGPPDTAASPPDTAAGVSGRSRGSRALLAVLCLAQFMLILDVAVVAVALPTMQRDLDISAAYLLWIGTAYSIGFGGFLVVAGRLADLLGSKVMLLTGVLVFAVGSLACGLTDTGWVLFVARGVQGLGAAMVSPAALSILMVTFSEGAAKARALGVWGAVSAGGGAVGQLLGGLFTGLGSWRLIFLVNVPFAVVVVWAVLRHVTERPRRAAGRADLAGAALLTGGMILLVLTASQAAAGGYTAGVLLIGVAALLMLAVFWLVERKVSEPIVPLELFRNRNVSLGNVICFAASGVTLATIFFAALLMQRVMGAGSLAAGLTFAPVSALITVAALRSGALVSKFGVHTVLLISGGLNAIGLVMLALAPADGNYLLHVAPALVVFGIGGGLGFAPAMFVASTGVEPARQGLASGLLSTSQQIGGVIALAVINLIAVRVTTASGGPDSAEALTDGFRAGFLAALVLPAIVAVAVLALRRTPAAPMAPAEQSAP
ncbi:MFS transporter [Micromonospora sp. NPDC007271]|uniref:MFS transporter n=1 Tax=Micromonospora sp. NPDC007271 TaxID=3154587 RepID=UPI0033C052ED